nr:protein kinase-like domain, concanavalin A-like lectin/glucanase domain protein [Tanacetum cinerariifolium]
MIRPKQSGKFQNGKPKEEEQEEKDNLENINANSSSLPGPLVSFKFHKLNSLFELLNLVLQSSNIVFVYMKGDDDDVMFIEIIKKNDDSRKAEPKVGNFTYVIDFMIVEDISSIIVPRLPQVVLGKPFVEISNMTYDPLEGVMRFTNGTDEIAYKMPIR